ncbi:MAG: putative toxin-antitoxin system toxin component, PIN family [Nanoarchaeota archaeon]|nr:putative toxin-antitoxin system toxin component, PIN family [Nanoarchaeota archaeon]
MFQMKITIDTNVLISGSFWAGASDKILEKIENKEIELFLSKDIIEEFSEVLDYEEIKNKIRDKGLELRRTIEKIISISTIIEPLEKFDIVEEDPDDNKILECAVEGKVNYIISQDKHLLKLKEFQDIKILTPEEFCSIL